MRINQLIHKVSDGANLVATVIACLGIVTTAGACFVQVFTRYVLNDSLSWTEELCRYAAIVVYMFGFSIAVKHGSNPKIDLLSSLLKGKGKIVHALLCSVATIICGGFILYFGIQALPMGQRSLSSVLGIPTSWMYLVIMASQLIGMIHCLSAIVDDVEALRKGKEA